MRSVKRSIGIGLLLKAAVMIGLIALPASGHAATLPIPALGKEAPHTPMFATGSGDVIAYFVGYSASYTNEIGLVAGGVDTKVTGLSNKTSSYGQSFNFGSFTRGQELVFSLRSLTTGHTYFSDPDLNKDGFNHAFVLPFAGGALKKGGSILPMGLLIGFEDIYGGGDRDYNDHVFVVTNVATTRPQDGNVGVPGPVAGAGIPALLALGGLAWARRNRTAG